MQPRGAAAQPQRVIRDVEQAGFSSVYWVRNGALRALMYPPTTFVVRGRSSGVKKTESFSRYKNISTDPIFFPLQKETAAFQSAAVSVVKVDIRVGIEVDMVD